MPIPDEPDGIDARLSVRSFPVGDRAVSERGDRADAPRRAVVRARHRSSFRSRSPTCRSSCAGAASRPSVETQWEQLVGVADRVIVDSSEWESLRYHELADVFELTAVSDIAWARTDEWRIALAAHWPAIASQEIAIRGPRAEAALAARAGSPRGSTATWLPSSRRASSACASTARRSCRRTRRPNAERPAQRRARPARARPDLRAGGFRAGRAALTRGWSGAKPGAKKTYFEVS